MKFFISDLHFYHENVIKFDNRPFTSIEDMNTQLINNWNETVSKGDEIYILGDFCWKTASSDEYIQLLNNLRGHKHLIRGNHDPRNMSATAKKLFASISDYAEVKEDGLQFLLCHYPMPMYKGSYNHNNWMFYGHVHTTKEAEYMKNITHSLIAERCTISDNLGQLMNVGCMMPYMNWQPQPAKNIIEAWHQIFDLN